MKQFVKEKEQEGVWIHLFDLQLLNKKRKFTFSMQQAMQDWYALNSVSQIDETYAFQPLFITQKEDVCLIMEEKEILDVATVQTPEFKIEELFEKEEELEQIARKDAPYQNANSKQEKSICSLHLERTIDALMMAYANLSEEESIHPFPQRVKKMQLSSNELSTFPLGA